MKITDEFIKQLNGQRNLQSVITNSAIIARCIQELQQAVDEVKIKVGLPRGNDETE